MRHEVDVEGDATEAPTNAPTNAPDDAALVARAQRDPREFAALYARYVGPVYRYCFHRLGNRPDAEDATSKVFAQALAALPRYRDGAFRAWLFTIAHRVVVDSFRRAPPTLPLMGADDRADPAPGPDELALAAQRRASLYVLLAALPEDQRRVMELRLSGLTSAEVARVLGRSPGAVRSLQFRAVGRLRDLLGVAADAEDEPNGPE